jgi:hypothetical protein
VSDHEWELVLTIIGLLLCGIGSLVAMNYASMKKSVGNLSQQIAKLDVRLDKQDDRVEACEKFSDKLAACQVECVRTFVSKEDWVRSEAFTRVKLDDVAMTLSRVEGKLDIVNKLPEIAGSVAREILGGKPR